MEEALLQHGGGHASGTVDLVFDVGGDGAYDASVDMVTVGVDASASEIEAALRTLGGLLEEVEVSIDTGSHRARNGGGQLLCALEK